MTDYSKMTGPELVAAYNAMVDRGLAAGMPAAAWRHVKKFETNGAGAARCVKLEAAIQDLFVYREWINAFPGAPSAEIAAGVAEASADANRDLRPNHLKANEQTRTAEAPVSTERAKKTRPAGEKKSKAHPAGKAADFRPVRAGTARARVVEAATRAGATLASVAAHAGVDRRTLMTHLFCLGRDCAIGYELDGEGVKLLFPATLTAADAIKADKK